MTSDLSSARRDCRQMAALLPTYVDGMATEIDQARESAHRRVAASPTCWSRQLGCPA
jgi:hypothetical protein